MKKVAIVGVEGSGKTVMLAGLGDLYTYPDEDGYFLAPKNFETATYVAEKIKRMRRGEWPSATTGDEMRGLDWTLKRRELGARKPPENVCEVSFLDFAGEVYRAAYGISDGDDDSLTEQSKELKQYVCGADELIVLINLRDVISNGLGDQRVQEAMWITRSILDTVLGNKEGTGVPRAAIVLSQADRYAETIKSCGGATGVLQKYLPHVANDYGGWLDVFAANAIDKTVLDDDGNMVPAADFTTQGLLSILKWIRGEKVLDDVAIPNAEGGKLPRQSESSRGRNKIQLWVEGPYWAETNIGADEPWEYGCYFWWGDTVGYKRENNVWVACDGSSCNFSFGSGNAQTYNRSIASMKSGGWITDGNVLAPEHDAAQVQWGGGWRMPTAQELKDLCEKCDWRWTQMNGVNGYLVRGRGEYASAKIFLPATGYGYGPSLYGAGSYGYYWPSDPYSDYHYFAWYFYFSSSYHRTSYHTRLHGQSVRPVQGFGE